MAMLLLTLIYDLAYENYNQNHSFGQSRIIVFSFLCSVHYRTYYDYFHGLANKFRYCCRLTMFNVTVIPMTYILLFD